MRTIGTIFYPIMLANVMRRCFCQSYDI